MKRFFNKELTIYILYVLVFTTSIWFLTKLWIPKGYAVVGHDSGLAVNIANFLTTRTFAWDVQDFGRDNSPHFGSLIMHGLDYIFSLIAGVPFAGNQITIFFWLSAIFVAGFVFALSLRDKLGKFFVFLFPVFVTFNFYILQSIFIFERAKYSILVAILLFLTIALKVHEKKIGTVLGGILVSLVLFVFNSGSWLGLPLYGGFFVVVTCLLLIEVLFVIKNKNYSSLGRFVLFLLASLVGFVILNAYSIFPYVLTFLKSDVYSVTTGSVISQNESWLEMISRATSFLSLFRFQGVPDWYSGATGINLEHSYAGLYLGNPILIILSFVFPVLAFASFILMRTKEQKRLLGLFGFLTLLSMFFVAGSHEPIGFLYKFFYVNIPGFSIFRSPYFKFSSAFYIGASVLMAFTISRIIELISLKLKNFRVIGSYLLVALSLIFWFGYYCVIFFPGKIFMWQTGLSTRVRVPNYVFSFGSWANSSDLSGSRILLVPELNELWESDAYSWGYWSLTNLPSVVSNQSFVTNDVSGDQKAWIDKLYSSIKAGKEDDVLTLSQKLGIDYILLRRDVLSDSSWSATSSPEIYQKSIESFSSLEKVNSFDQWVIYKFRRPATPKLFAISSLVPIPTDYSYLAQDHFSNNNVVLTNNVSTIEQFLSSSMGVLSCRSCPLEGLEALSSLPNVHILPNSPLYFFKEKSESKTLQSVQGEQAKSDAYLGFSLRRGAEIKAMWDMGTDTKYAVASLATTGDYLNTVYDLFKSEANTDKIYFDAKKVVDNLNIVEQSFRDIVASSGFGKKTGDYREGILSVLWNINRLKSLFSAVNDRDKLETEKVYKVDALNKEDNRDLLIDASTLPVDVNGQAILPAQILFESEGKLQNLSFNTEKAGLIHVNLPVSYQSGDLRLEFPIFPNLLGSGSISTEISPGGSRGCYKASLRNFNPQKLYRVEIVAREKTQGLRLFIKDAELPPSTSGFLKGQDEVDISPTLSGQTFNYIYVSSAGAKNSVFYLCSNNAETPVFDKFEVHEIASPTIISVVKFSQKDLRLPETSFEYINPTSYSVKISNASSPFILVFNETYSPFWKVVGQNFQHFSINGYENAWIIDKNGNYNLNLEYEPQKLFSIGKIVSAIGLPLVLIAASYLVWKRKNEKI